MKIKASEFEETLRNKVTPTPDENNPDPKSPIRFKVKTHTGHRLSIYETDDLVKISINPRRIKNQSQLDHTMSQCVDILTR